MHSLNIVRSLSYSLATPRQLTACLPLVRWGPEAWKKSQTDLIQSVFLRTQFHETQLHIHRMFALKEPLDPDLSESSMAICLIASKECITIVESVKDVMIVPVHSFLLVVSLGFACAVQTFNVFPHVEVSVYVGDIPSPNILEETGDGSQFSGVSCH